MAMPRMCRLPARLMPRSREESPLWWGVGVRPIRLPTWRRFLNSLQESSGAYVSAPTSAMPRSVISRRAICEAGSWLCRILSSRWDSRSKSWRWRNP